MSFRNAITRLNSTTAANLPQTINAIDDRSIERDKIMGLEADVPSGAVFTDTTSLSTTAISSKTVGLYIGSEEGTATSPNRVNITGGTNVQLARDSNGNITISTPNFAENHTYTSTANRNAATDVTWHTGDLAIVTTASGTTSYIYNGATSGNNNSGATVDADWTVLHTPAQDASAQTLFTTLNGSSGMTFDDDLLSTNIARAADVPDSLNDLDDVAITTAVDDQFLRYNGTSWVNETVTLTTALSTLTDVTTTAATDDQVLQWDSATSMWAPSTLPTGVTTIGGLTDVSSTAATDDQVLQWDTATSMWAPSTLPTGVTTFAALSDTPATGTSGQILQYGAGNTLTATTLATLADNATNGIALQNLHNVSDTAPSTNGHVLTWNSTDGAWEPAAIPEGAASSVQNAAPAAPSVGDLWFDADNDPPALYVYTGTEDGWVASNPRVSLPNSPAGASAARTYNLQITESGEASWVAVTTSNPTLSQDVGIASNTGRTADQTAFAANTFFPHGSSTGLATVAAVHELSYNGLKMVEGPDYTVSSDRMTINLTTASASAIDLTNSDNTLVLTNFTVS